MALLFLKSTLLPGSKAQIYSLLPNHKQDQTPPPHSRDASFESNSTVTEMALHQQGTEKSTAPQSTSPMPKTRCRIDPRLISDATIGLSDGLTVPFALTAGLSALGDTKVVIYGGLAELIAGGISMGLGGYLGAKSEAQAYEAALSETRKIMSSTDRSEANDLIRATVETFNLSSSTLDAVVAELSQSPADSETFLMRFHYQLSESTSNTARAYASALTIATGYFLGGLMPLLPYFIARTNHIAFLWSVAVMAVALFAFGYVKTMLVGEGLKWTCVKSGVQMMVMGGIAAAAAMGSVKAIAGIGG